MTHHGLREGWYLVDGQKAYVQLLLGKWMYFILLRGWKQLKNERWEKINAEL